jgi:hypothetical protein
MDPREAAIEAGKREMAREQAVGARLDAETLRNNTEARDNLLKREQADLEATKEVDDIRADAKALAQESIDPRRYIKNRSAGDLVGQMMLALVSGMANPGGPNSGVEMMKQGINQDIEAQVADLANDRELLGLRKGAVAELFEKNGDAYRSAETVRLAVWEGVANQLKTEGMKYDPMGTAAQRIAASVRAAEMEAATASLKLEEGVRKRKQEDAELKIKQGHLAQGWAQEKRMKIGQKAELASQGLDEKGNPIAGWTPPVTPKTIEEAAKADKAVSDAEAARLALSPEERTRQFGVGGLKNKKGEPILFRNTDVAGAVTKLKSSTDRATALLDNLIVARDAHGFSSNTVKSDEWQQMQSDYANLQLEIKNTAELGVLAGPDMDIIGRALGTDDPTEFRNVTAGMKAARSNLVKKLNSTIKSNNDDAAYYEPPKSEPIKALERTKSENAKLIAQGIPPHARGDEAARAEFVEQARLSALVNSKRDDVTPAEIRKWSNELGKLVESGQITPEERALIVAPLLDRETKKASDDTRAEKAVEENVAYEGFVP